MTDCRFDPVSPAELRARTSDALDELSEFHCHDPAAAGAMRAVRLTRYTLEWFWIPTLDDLLSSDRDSQRVERV